MPKINIQPDPSFDALGHSYRYAMRMTVQATDGRSFERESRHRPGSPERAMSQQQLIDKFRLLAAPVLTDATVDRIIATVSDLDRIATTTPLADLLVPPPIQEIHAAG